MSLMYRKETIKKVGLFDENFKIPAGEDIDFKNKVAEKYKDSPNALYLGRGCDVDQPRNLAKSVTVE